MLERNEFDKFCSLLGMEPFSTESYGNFTADYDWAKDAMAQNGDVFLGVTSEIAQKLGAEKEYVALIYCVQLAYEMQSFYHNHDIADVVFYDTMGDIAVWQKNYLEQTGKIGIAAVSWLYYHLNGKVFRLGRLQFEMCAFEDGCEQIAAKAPVLGIHIPQGEPLSAEACGGSLNAALPFFKRHFGYIPEAFTCFSWLLDSALLEILPLQSNILKFQSRFTVFDRVTDDAQSIERIFGLAREKQAPLPEETSLQRAAKAYMATGRRFGMGKGYIKI